LEDSKTYLYITALDKNQIGGVPGVGLERFKGITEENAKSAIVELGFKRYDDRAYYEDLGATKREDGDSRRHVLVFNPELFKDERRQREERIRKAQEYMKEEGESLLKAKRSRQRKPTEQRIDSRLKELRARRYIRYELEETELEGGTRTFRLRYSRETEAIGKAELTDGLCVLVTNITDETEPKKYRLGPPELIKAYRDKYRAEDAFRDLKSFIKFQPTFVYTDEHVRAHYTICVLSYLLDVTVTNRLRESPIEGVGSVREVYKLLERGRIGELKVRGSDRTVMKLVTPRAKEKEVLDLFGCEYLIGRKHLKSMLAE
jgi:transposase